MTRILLTGATGFLGMHIANALYRSAALTCLKRKNSDLSGYTANGHAINWINTDDTGWEQQVLQLQPDVIIHAAWIGVTAADRDNWELQSGNISLLQQLLTLAAQCGTKQFIGMGSQAEYGNFEGVISESEPVHPESAYGAAKVFCSQLLASFCGNAGIQGYWLRLFSFFGEGEGSNWLIPATVRRIVYGENMALTPGQQQYAYLYAGCLGLACSKIITAGTFPGIYNISASRTITIRELVEQIRDHLDPGYPLHFGELPYRKGQPMHIQGDMRKFTAHFGELDCVPFTAALQRTIAYYKNKYNRERQ